MSLLLPQAEVWVVVVVDVKPAFSLGGFVTVVVVVPQSFTLSAKAAGENENKPTAVSAAKVVATVRFLSAIGLLL
ncbi:hypothetical protein [Bradyrhizobium cosmicum]|uniref:hypothetical protein n=1 Tax=Bradyrhizobium cosmicum TaxID=1404864 RepID=UPI0028EA36FA|nr:hypothetical protein [Bradyrhizobium cosmicum]